MSDERFDSMLLAIAQQQQGIDGILETFFSFLNRKTDFFSQPDMAKATVDRIMTRYIAAGAEKRRQLEQKQREAAAKPPPPPPLPTATTTTSRVEVLDDDEDEEATAAAAAKEAARRKMELEKQQAAVEAAQRQKKEAEGEDAVTAAEEIDAPSGLPPTAANGFAYENYIFTQTLQEAEVRVPLPAKGVKGRQLNVVISSQHLTVGMKGQPPIIDGDLFSAVKVEESMWTIEDGCTVVVTLYKQNTMEWWRTIIRGDPEIDLQKVVPENSKLDDLDADTRQTVEKMMYDQRQKMMGKPTSEEQKRQDMLKRFMEAHPEMDFSQAKFC